MHLISQDRPPWSNSSRRQHRDSFRCRPCHGLRYASQLVGRTERPRVAAQRIRLRLGASGNLTEPFPEKPDGVRWSAYYRMRAKGERYEARALAGLASWGGIWNGDVN